MYVYGVWRDIDRSFNEILFWYENGNYSQGFDQRIFNDAKNSVNNFMNKRYGKTIEKI